jgi:EAL and modified HD-GYP domain-containing signal transduction protein
MSDIFVTRQPVFDRTDTAVAYELRFRPSDDGSDPFAASARNGSLELLRSDLPAWVRATREQLVDGTFITTEASALVVLVPPDIGIDEEVIAAVTKLAAHGVRVALDEFVLPQDSGAPLYRLLKPASMVRLDLRCQTLPALTPMLKTLKAMGKKVAADHVIDTTMYRDCFAAGFDAFQGPHFSHPEPLPLAALPASTVVALRLLALARDPETPDRELESTISADPGITYQLLRIVNSAALGGFGITSIPHALRLVGRTNLICWLGLASATSRAGAHGTADELIRQAVQRARFCESLAVPSNGLDKGTLFLIGLFSLLDAVFRVPMFEILNRVNLSVDFKDALLERSGAYADPLMLVELYELGLWQGAAEAAERLEFDPARLATCYGDSVQWAHERMPTAVSRGSRGHHGR